MSHNQLNFENLEIFVNDYLKEDLKYLEHHINYYNGEIMEFVQLKNTVETMCESLPDGYKTQMNIGGNVFMEAKVQPNEKILVDVGKSCFVEFSPEEAIKFADFKIKLLTKECEVLRQESIKKKSEIKLALLVMAEREKLHAAG